LAADGHVIDHYGFSYPDIQPVHDRMKANGVEVVKGITWDQGLQMKSFFIRAPDGVLIEVVEADPLPDASWLRRVHFGLE
jgi:catechol 2,3-dioxygenase-like lactoylglutathione lyase family enzyme